MQQLQLQIVWLDTERITQVSSQGTDLNVYCGTKLQQQFGQGDVAYASSLVESCSILIFSINLHKDRDSARDTFTTLYKNVEILSEKQIPRKYVPKRGIPLSYLDFWTEDQKASSMPADLSHIWLLLKRETDLIKIQLRLFAMSAYCCVVQKPESIYMYATYMFRVSL